VIPMRLADMAEAVRAACPVGGGAVLVTGVTTDSRACRAGDLFVAVRGERFDGHDFVAQAAARGAAACVVSRPVPSTPCPALHVEDTVAALGRLAVAHRRRLRATVIAVTGSNGKTTTKGMLHHLLGRRLRGRAAVRSFNNHLGVPLTLLSAEAEDEFLVVEIGSSGPGEVDHLGGMVEPEVGVVTSVGPAHLEGFGSIEGVRREKLSLLRRIRPGGLAVVHAGVPEAAVQAARPPRVELVTFGRGDAGPPAEVCISDLRAGLEGVTFRINAAEPLRLSVCGEHNALNAAAAYAVCRRLNLSRADIAEGLASYAPADMRLNVRRCGDLTLINDCYNANPASVAAAIDLLASAGGRRRVLAVGDMLELGADSRRWHERSGAHAAAAGLDVLIAVGTQAEAVAGAARAARPAIETMTFGDSAAAAGEVGHWVRSGDVILVKGSRATAMERVAEAIVAWAGASGRSDAAVA